MEAIDWNAPAALHQRDDAGSDMHYHFKTLRRAPLGELVREVAAMAAVDRARLVIDVEGGKSLNLGEILDLAAREDLP